LFRGLIDAPGVDFLDVAAALLEPDGRLASLLRFSYEFRLHRARGYGALKAILGILAEDEPLTLTDIAQRLRRTPGSTKDYLSWLEDVDMLSVERKRYAFEDPLMRLYVQLYGAPAPPTRDEIRAAVERYAQGRQGPIAAVPAPEPLREPVPAVAAFDYPRDSGIIEID